MTDLLRELRDETTTLFKQEVALAKTEMTEKARRVGKNSVYLAMGGMVAFGGFLVILMALSALALVGLETAGLSTRTALWLGPALVGIIVALIGYGLIKKATNTLSQESMAPEKTIESVQEDKEWMQQKIKRG